VEWIAHIRGSKDWPLEEARIALKGPEALAEFKRLRPLAEALGGPDLIIRACHEPSPATPAAMISTFG
jgi:hypothetical protein